MITHPDWPEPVADPQTVEDAVANLRHTLAVFGEGEPGDRMVLMATSNIYGDRVRTGLTFADLRLVLGALDNVPATAPPPSGAAGAPTYATGGYVGPTHGTIRDTIQAASDRAHALPAYARPTVTRPVFNGGQTDADLPGMWERADFLGGATDVVRTSGPLDPEIHAALVRSVERARGSVEGISAATPVRVTINADPRARTADGVTWTEPPITGPPPERDLEHEVREDIRADFLNDDGLAPWER